MAASDETDIITSSFYEIRPRRIPMNLMTNPSYALPLRALIISLAFSFLLSGCGFLPTQRSDDIEGGGTRGIASWYGNPYHGRKTANGETYDMHALTAAHRTLPFGSIVRVRRSDDKREVQVRINDRGPFFINRVIDLSREAARRIGMLRRGTTEVSIEPLYIPREPNPKWMILVGGFMEKPEAQEFADYFHRNGTTSEIRPGWHGNYEHYHVQIKGLVGESKAKRLVEKLQRNGYGAFIVRAK